MPVWGGFLTPVLQVLSDGRLRKRRDLQAAVFDHMGLTTEERAEVLPSGQHRANNRLGWALSGLYRAELVEKPARATFVITEAGRALLAAHPDGIDEKTLKALPAYQSYVPTRPEADEPGETGTVADPLEQIEAGISRLDADVAAELLKRLLEQPPKFLERTVLKVLVAMGYGGADRHATHIGGSGDGGIDGVIDQDPLGLDQIYVQAKRYAPENTVQRPALQEFVGALHGMGASRGVFITTSSFTNGARQYVQSVPTRIVLIDGRRLAALMIKYRVGAQKYKTFTVVEVDEDYFD
ncbi:MAG: restriction endonuclease [Nocardia sp.]|nr:restriction endonuclease [Nocardia sp.]